MESLGEEEIPSPAHLDGVAYLYGPPLLNSLSPPLHHTIYDALSLNWAQIPLSVSDISSSTYPPPYTLSPPIEKLVSSIRSNAKFVGSSVTMPWKVSIMPHLDDLTEQAKQIGACNTIFLRNREGKKFLHGGSSNEAYRNKPALIIGGGGTARAAIYTLRKWLGSSKIYIINRDWAEIEAILEEDAGRMYDSFKAEIVHISEPTQIDELETPVAIVSGIPDYLPKTLEEIKTRQIIQAVLSRTSANSQQKGVILEMCYHPNPQTQIAELARQAEWKVIPGTEALIWQGLEQTRLWTGKDIIAEPGLVQRVKDVIAKMMEERTGKKPHL